jgi:glycosyltransferase involved in cell wall biosynthesis
MEPGVSIIIATRNRAESLRLTLASLERVSIPPGMTVETLVIDNGSTDRTRTVVEEAACTATVPLRYIFEARPGKACALNTALRHAAGNILLFSDDDVRFPPRWIEEMSTPIAEGRAAMVQGGIVWPTEIRNRVRNLPHLSKFIACTEGRSAAKLEQHGLIGANMAIARAALDGIGGFDEELGPGALGFGEETLAGWRMERAGWRKLIALDVQVEHHFDTGRLNRTALLHIAARRGRSLAYIQHHWLGRRERMLRLRRLALSAKNALRTALTPAAWRSCPEWKFSYHADVARLAQLEAAARTPRKYARE